MLRHSQLEGQVKQKADISDLERRPLKADVDASLKMQVKFIRLLEIGWC